MPDCFAPSGGGHTPKFNLLLVLNGGLKRAWPDDVEELLSNSTDQAGGISNTSQYYKHWGRAKLVLLLQF